MIEAVPACRRCGVCCRRGGPSLSRRDLPLVASGLLRPARLMVLRRGEHVADNVAGGVGPLAVELVRLRPGPDGRGCLFFREPHTCSVHSERPEQCRTLSCDAPGAVAATYLEDRLSRRDILASDDPLAALCAHHEAETDLVRLALLCRRALAGHAPSREEVARAVRLDAAFRELLPARAGVAAADLPFYLGRPLARALPVLRAALGVGGLYKPVPSA
ncbi:YkgJ family cysteine cluster protein [Solidesulfovibrio sp.]|uniref:YkgJ family cysteine cluster protein n=1 Tax=Solidesulfovibrio sp. TaxID=2910990 RepID=UPI00262C65D0|nr:YkgJ family cysteine cluster protein [Solidesulfovibrio sp.]